MLENTLEDQRDDCRDLPMEEYIQEYLDNVAGTLEISSPKFVINFGTKIGDNNMTIIYRVLIEGEKNDNRVKMSTILKVPPHDEMSRLLNRVSDFFSREVIFYAKLVPLFNQQLQTHNKILGNIPKCYFSSSYDHKEAIFLEDLYPLGFRMRDRIKQMDFAHMSLTLHALGRFHAVSFAMRDQSPEEFTRKVATLEEPLFKPNLLNNPIFIRRTERLRDLVKTALIGEDPHYTERFTEFAKDFLGHIRRFCSGSLAEPYAVLTHGDLWTNNVLFRYDKDSMEPVDLYFVDFQVSRYASPAADISHILFTSCSQELRNKHFDDFVKIYHKSSSNYLQELGSDPEKLLPYNALLDQLKQFSITAGVMVILILAAFTCQGNDIYRDAAKLRDVSLLEERIHRDHFWRNTLRDSIKDLIDRNYI